MKNKQLIIYSSIILSMLCWSLSFVWTKIVYLVYNPITTVTLRLLISTTLLYLFAKGFNKLQRIAPKDRWPIIALAFFEPFMYFMGESFGLKYVSSTLGAVIISTIPLFSPIAAFYFHKERLTIPNIIGILVSILGVSVIIFNKQLALVASPIGLTLLFIAVFAAVGYSIFLKNLAKKYNPLTIITYQNFIGIFFFLPLFLIFDLNHFLEAHPTTQVITALINLAVFASSLAFIFFTYALKHLGITKSNAFINVIPVFTAIFAFFILKENLGVQKIIGILIVMGGLFFSQSKISIFHKKSKYKHK